LQAREKVGDIARIKQVRVFAEEAPTTISCASVPIRGIRSRAKTADHSLPYIVAAAVLDGHVRTDSFNPRHVLEPHASIF